MAVGELTVEDLLIAEGIKRLHGVLGHSVMDLGKGYLEMLDRKISKRLMV